MAVLINTVNFYGNTFVNNSVAGCQIVNNYHTAASRITKLLLQLVLNRQECIKILLEELETQREQLSPETQQLLSEVRGFIDESDFDIKALGEQISEK